MSVSRSFSTAYAVPDSTFRVTLHLDVDTDVQGVGIREELPYGWMIHPVENAGAAFKRSEGEWVFSDTVEAGTRLNLVYEVTIPSSDALLSSSLPLCFDFRGTYQATVPSFELPILGESSLEVVSHLPIGTALAHMIPAADGRADSIDLRLSRILSDAQLRRALELWQHDLPVPGTGGERIDLAMINHLAALHETCTRVDDALPLSIDPSLDAVRTLETFLPCDSVLLPEGCLDPGASSRQVTVRVQITPSFNAYGVSLKEWLPTAWRITPIDHEGFWYRPSSAEWVYPDLVRAGETVEIVYEIDVASTATDVIEAASGCCGQEMRIIGEASSALECSVAPVTGEDSVDVLSCVPVILAISRWDVEEDRFDAKLSDTISLPQVQRAVEFWQQSLPVPHTCGYTVGYETLKRIVTYWLTDTLVSSPLPLGQGPTCGEPSGDCSTATCIEGWLCQMAQMQDPNDFVGFPEPPLVEVSGGPDRILTCVEPSTRLTADVRGGFAPFRYTWIGPDGQIAGQEKSIEVREPGLYTITVTTCGGCQAMDQVSVRTDFAAPLVQASASGILSGYVTTVDLTATISGGVPPYTLLWTSPSGEPFAADTLQVSVDEPGLYTLTATGVNGCSQSSTLRVEQDIEPPVVNVEIQAVALAVQIAPEAAVLTCSQPELLLLGRVSGGTAPFEYVWSNAQGNPLGTGASLRVAAPGTYALSVTGSNGIRSESSVEISQDIEPPQIDVASDGKLTCIQSNVRLRANVSEGTPPYTFEWRGPVDTVLGHDAELTVTQPGAYTVTVTGANGCSNRESIAVVEDREPPIVHASVDDTLTCTTASVVLTAEIEAGRPPYAIDWRDADGRSVSSEESLSVSEPGEYRVIVTGANGCSSETSVEVEQDIGSPRIAATADRALSCSVSNVQLAVTVAEGTPPFSYRWTGPSGQAAGFSEKIAVSSPGTYHVEVTGANGCSETTFVTVHEDVEAPTVSIETGGILTCTETSVSLTADVSGGRPPYSYAWANPAGSIVGEEASLRIESPGTYSLVVTGANGCQTRSTARVEEDVAPPIVSISGNCELTCDILETTLTANASGGTAPYSYAWIDPLGAVVGHEPNLMVSSAGSYSVLVTGANGCATTGAVEVIQDISPPSVDVGPDRVLTCTESQLHIDPVICDGRGPFTYEWTDDCGVAIAATKSIVLEVAGTYTLTVTGANGCSSSDSLIIANGINPPQVDAGLDQVLACVGDEVLLDASVMGGACPYEFTWVDSCGDIVGRSEDLVVTLPGTYILTVRSADGCVGMDSVTVELP